MNVVVFHGSPRRGNTYRATHIFLDELMAMGDVALTEFFLPEALPVFCTGCQCCMSGPCELCPHTLHTAPIVDAILRADALLFTTPHYGACSMSAGMKTLLDHLDFFTLTVAPRRAMFGKKAFILTTAAGAASAGRPIQRYLKNWGINRVYTLGLRLFTNEWSSMSDAKQHKFEQRLRRAARKFYRVPRRAPYLSTVGMYYVARVVIKKYIGEGNYPYEYWKENGYFRKRPF